jgi:alpha-D-ribose 1-methylphosphonate 5-triphosphate synthase subunit PhnH
MIARVETVHTAQRTFRALLYALAHPGRVTPLEEFPGTPLPFSPVVGAFARTMFDVDVTVWIGAAGDLAAAWLTATTGARIVADAAAAQFAVITDAREIAPLVRWNAGTAEDPETSATLLVQIDALSGGPNVALSGPGIDGEILFAPRGLGADFWSEWSSNAGRYPLGVDVFFADAHAVVGLPRTVRGVPR